MPTDVARLQRRHKALLDVGPGALIVDRTATQARCCDAIVGQGDEHRHRAPASMWYLGSQRSTAPRHPCGRIMLVLARVLVDEHAAGRIDAPLVPLRPIPPTRDVRPILEHVFF